MIIAMVKTYPRLSFPMNRLFMIEKNFNGFDELFADRMQQGVFSLDSMPNQEFDHLKIFIIDSHQKSGSPQRINAIDIDIISLLGSL